LIAQKARIISLFRIDFEKSLLVEHYYFRARHLDPIMGRFLQTDPMGYQDSLNLYQALNMNPVNFVDPFGKQHQVTVTPEGAEFERPMTVGEFWETLMEAGVSQKEALNLLAESTYYSKFFCDGSLVDRIKTHRMDLTLTNSEARALGMEYNITLKGPREQFGRLIRGEFKEFKDAALENLDRAFGNPENAALMFSGGVKYKGGKPYPFFNKKGILQWRDPSTGQFTKSPIRLPEGVEWPKGFGDPTKWKSMLKDITAEVDEMKASREFYERLSKSKSAGDLWDAIEASIKKSKKTYGDILFEQIEKALKKEKK
jgi:RHS repeat-associated protein